MNTSRHWIRSLFSIFPHLNITCIEKNQHFLLENNTFTLQLSGFCHVYLYTPSIGEPMLFEQLYPHQYLLHPKAPLYFSLHARQHCSIISLNMHELKQWQTQNPSITRELFTHSCNQQSQLMQRLCWQQLSVKQRLHSLLFEHYKEHKELHFNHKEIAMMIGSSRETVSRHLKYFSQCGLIQTSIKCIKKTNALAPHPGQAHA